MATIGINGVSLSYPGGHLGLADIDLTVADGEFVALIGPSGSGKTTLLRTVAGFLTPTAGTVTMGDEVVAGEGRSVPPEKRGLGMVFQQHAVWPHWSVGKNIEYPLRRQGVDRASRRRLVDEALELVGLAGAARRSPATLSGGQRQRVAIARAIVARPQVLLLDEALSALDEPLRDSLRLELRRLTRELGLTVLHVTHDRSEALALADRVAVLKDGRLQQVGTPQELLARPGGAFVARFLSDAALLPVRLSPHGECVLAADGVAGCRFSPAALTTASEGAGAGGACLLAVQPEQVRLHRERVAEPGYAGTATVQTTLFGRDGYDTVLSWQGMRLRSRGGHELLSAGDTVHVYIAGATAFPAEEECPAVAAGSAEAAETPSTGKPRAAKKSRKTTVEA